jgi:hypothetical protein
MADVRPRYPWQRLVYLLDAEPPYRDHNGWVASQPAGHLAAAPMETFRDLPVVALLGERGVGKSDILMSEARRLDGAGACSRFVDLGLAGTAGLASALAAAAVDVPRFVLLDSLDEVLDRNPGAWQSLVGCLEDLGAGGRAHLRLRISCRSSRWPARLKDALEDMWPGQVSYLGVAGLTRDDVAVAAELNGLGASFIAELEQRRLVVPMASWPVTLNPLLAAAAQDRPLPASLAEAFSQACERLCTETNPTRRDGITPDHPGPAALLAIGRRLAAALQFGADGTLADLVDEGAGLTLAALVRGSEPDGAGREVAYTEHLLRKLTESALLAPLGPRRWGFAHHSFQEFLAAQYLQAHGIPVQVRRALLLAGDGPARHVVASQREVAAWAAVSDDELFDDILASDPEVLLLADMAVRPAGDRGRLAGALLDLAREDFTIQLDSLLLYRLDYPGLAGQLAPRLETGRPPNELYAALLIARACPQPSLTSELMAVAEDPGISESLRSLAIEAVAVDSAESANRLMGLVEGEHPDLAGAVLARLWPGWISTADMLGALPEPRANVLAAAWSFIRAVPERLQPGDLADALTWAAEAAARRGRDHAALAVRILSWAIGISEALEARNDAHVGESVTARFAEALIGLVRSGNIHEQGMPLDGLGDQLTASPAFRRAAGRKILEQAAVEDIGDLTFSTPACLFPLEDAAYWAQQLPFLPDELAGKLGFPLRHPLADPAQWGPVWELAQASDTVRRMTGHWFALPVNHALAIDARRKRDRERREQQRRAVQRFDEAALRARLTALSAGETPVRQGWAQVIVDLHKAADGGETGFDHTLDLGSAPSFPQSGSELHERLLDAAAAVLRKSPVITADQVDPARLGLFSVPELCALSLLSQSGRLDPGELDAARWAGLALALIFVPTAPGDRALRDRLLAVGLERSGNLVEEAIPGLLDQLREHQLAAVMDRLIPVRTAGVTAQLGKWAHDQKRAPGQREQILDALARYGDAGVLDELRRAIPLTDEQERNGIDPGSPAGRQWLSNASIAARRDTTVSLPSIMAAVTSAPALARPFLERLAADTGFGDVPLDLSDTQPGDLAALYELITRHAPDSGVPLHDGTGALLFGPDQQLQRIGSQIIGVIAGRGTKEAAAQLEALAERYPDHWRLRELARQVSRGAAEQTSQPITIADLLKLAADSALRLVRDEHQLSDVVTESIERLQHLISAPNGWVTLLWHKSSFDAANGWWPIWEEDLSDFVATFLQHDLAERQVIVNREVQILRPGLDGRRTDVHVQASASKTELDPAPLTVIVECKGCWNKDLDAALSTQLVDKYLSMPGRNAGIYMVGYFDNAHWDHKKNPGREHAAHDLDTLRGEQAALARAEAARKAVSVTAFILDCRLPAGPAAASQ